MRRQCFVRSFPSHRRKIEYKTYDKDSKKHENSSNSERATSTLFRINQLGRMYSVRVYLYTQMLI